MITSITNNSLKEYYVKLEKMYSDAVNMLTAMNQSLTSSSSEVQVTLTSGDDASSVIRIPSMIYLENKLEQLENNFNNLFNMPSSGEAWFNNSSDMYKLEMITSNSAPVVPTLSTNNVTASITDNNFLKDLVSPKTFLKLNITNLPDNIEQMFMRKIIFNNSDVFNTIQNLNLTSYDEYVAALYNLTKGIDYDVYDSTIDLPIKSNTFKSAFKIVEIPELESGNPWTDATSTYNNHTHLSYKLVLDTLQYSNEEDTSIIYTLKPGDKICLSNKLVIYKVKHVNISDMSIIVEEQVGHIVLQTYEENANMVMSLYDDDYSNFHYVQVPLEENQFICVFLGCIYNNTRSLLSTPYLVNLGTIYMYDAQGNKIYDSFGNHMTYMEYYNEYCTNIGDLILGLTQSAYPQVSNYTANVLNNLQSGEIIESFVNNTIDVESVIKVVPINKHLIDSTSTEEIINLHAQKAELNAQLATLQENINNVYTTLISTDFSQEVSITQESLRSQLNGYYSERTTLNAQINSVINNISTASADVTLAKEDTKYRIRGIVKSEIMDDYLHDYAGKDVYVIGLDVEYKYKSTTKDTTDVTSINSNIFTDWNRLSNIDRQRKLEFNSSISAFNLVFEDYGSTKNIIKWNQIDIPIVQGEDVVMRIRYKYNIGQPFVNIYSPWSDEMTVTFPTEYADNVEVSDIIISNENDVVNARFSQKLMDDGYEEHINNKLIVNNATFYHMPENIYSGFNTSENNMISLKDKLQSMSTDIDNAKTLIDSEINKKYAIYLAYDNNTVELFNNTTNKINIYNTDHISDSFVKKRMNIIIKNTGESNIKFYSIFPGNVDIPLLLSENEFYEEYIKHYERVPLFVDSQVTAQSLGQWIYFRQDNPYTGNNIYYMNSAQDLQDFRAVDTTAEHMSFTSINTYMKKDYNQALLGYRKRNSGNVTAVDCTWIGLEYDPETNSFIQHSKSVYETESLIDKYSDKSIEFFKYYNDETNNYLLRFEDIVGRDQLGNLVYLDSESSISEFIGSNAVNGLTSGTGTFTGAFLYPDIDGRTTILTGGKYNDYLEIETGKSVSIPITFEYYIDGETITSLTKALYFDLRDSLVQNPRHYMLELTANYDYTSTGNLINSTTLQDEATI